MKRKNPDFNKGRKFIRKAKFSENLLSTSYLYIKLFFLWFLVVVSDFLIEFRFEYLWPLYLCIRNVYDIFKYQGLAFSAFFVFITLTSNAICFFLMPVQWLFFTASTYVWFQYVWNSEKGICLQTFTVWLIFVYVEATVRLKELKNMPSHLDLCRPMAGHCIGYPFVTLGFGFKKYLNYKIMLRRQKEVQAENELTFYTINKLHIDHTVNGTTQLNEQRRAVDEVNQREENNNNEQIETSNFDSDDQKRISNYSSNPAGSNLVLLLENLVKLTTIYFNAIYRLFISLFNRTIASLNGSLYQENSNSSNVSSIENSHNNNTLQLDTTNNNHSASSYNNQIDANITSSTSLLTQPDHSPSSINHQQQQEAMNEKDVSITADQRDKPKKVKQENKNEIKKLKADLQLSRQSEFEYKDKFNKMQVSRNELKFQCNKLQHDNTALQTKLQNFLNTKQQDKNLISELEKKLMDERKAKSQLEKQLSKYSKVVECGDACKQKRDEYDRCLEKLRDELRIKDLQFHKLNEDSLNDKQLLLAALDKMQNRTQQLENSLSSETKLKLDLFSALGETRRQLELNQILLFQKSNEVEDLNCKINELMAVSGHDPYSTSSIFLQNFITTNNELSNSKQSSDGSTSSMLKNNIQQASSNNSNNNNLHQNNDTNNLSNNSSSSTKGSLSDWKNLNHSLESSVDLTPKSSTNSDL